MKKLIIALIIANILYFAYSRFSAPEQEDVVVYRGEKGVPLLVTLNELDGPPAVTSHVPLEVSAQSIANKVVAAPSREQDLRSVMPPVVDVPAAKPDQATQAAAAAANDAPKVPVDLAGEGACLTIGPFSDLGVAKSARVELEKNKIDVKSRKEMRQIKGAFWVYLPSYPDKETAQAASKVLAENGIKDYFIISEEDQNNGISLGLYNKKSFSDRRRADIAGLGFKPQVATKERQREYWWLDLQTKAPIKDAAWKVDGLSKEIKLTRRECS